MRKTVEVQAATNALTEFENFGAHYTMIIIRTPPKKNSIIGNYSGTYITIPHHALTAVLVVGSSTFESFP